MRFLTVRHLSDQNVLKTYGQDGPLVPGQDKLLMTTADKVLSKLGASGKNTIRILYTEKTRRIKDTAGLLVAIFQEKGINVVFQHDNRLEVMDQGDLILPETYQDGDWFDPLDTAWDAICDEAYVHQNIFYRFGDHMDGKYPILGTAFSRPGASMGWSLIQKYSLISDLINGQFAHPEELLVIVAQSDLPLILLELIVLTKWSDVIAENLPYKCWEVYKSGLQDEMYDDTAIGDGNFDIPMGYVGSFDLSNFITNGFDQIVKNAQLFLQKQQKLK